VGGSQTSVTPVVDGYAMKSGSFKQAVGGNFLTQQALHLLEKELDITLRSHYEIASKRPVELKAAPNVVLKSLSPHVTDSFKYYAKLKVVEDFKETVCQVAETTYNAV